MNSEDNYIYTPGEAVRYLREKRGLIFTVDGLRNRRRHKQAHAERVLANTTLWTKAELDAIEPSKRTKRVKKNGDSAQIPSVMLIELGQAQLLNVA
jgi:hypothetical protein